MAKWLKWMTKIYIYIYYIVLYYYIVYCIILYIDI